MYTTVKTISRRDGLVINIIHSSASGDFYFNVARDQRIILRRLVGYKSQDGAMKAARRFLARTMIC